MRSDSPQAGPQRDFRAESSQECVGHSNPLFIPLPKAVEPKPAGSLGLTSLLLRRVPRKRPHRKARMPRVITRVQPVLTWELTVVEGGNRAAERPSWQVTAAEAAWFWHFVHGPAVPSFSRNH